MTGLAGTLSRMFEPCKVPDQLLNDIVLIANEIFNDMEYAFRGGGVVGVDADWMRNIFPVRLNNAIHNRYGANDFMEWLYGSSNPPYNTADSPLMRRYYSRFPQCN